jgi:hypothetical protein
MAAIARTRRGKRTDIIRCLLFFGVLPADLETAEYGMELTTEGGQMQGPSGRVALPAQKRLPHLHLTAMVRHRDTFNNPSGLLNMAVVVTIADGNIVFEGQPHETHRRGKPGNHQEVQPYQAAGFVGIGSVFSLVPWYLPELLAG